MAETHAAPGPALDLKTLLAEAKRIVAAAQSAVPPPVPPREDLAHGLRTRLAVRGWVNPHQLLGDAEPLDEVSRALNAIARETDSAFGLHPGDWYLSVASRRRVLASRGAAALKEELNIVRCPEDAVDPTRAAFRLALALDPMPPLDALPEEVLRALANVLDWLGPMARAQVDRQGIAADLAARGHRTDIARMTAFPMVGKAHQAALAVLSARLGRPIGKGTEATYVYGSGGAGKSTLLAYLQRDLELQGRAMVVRIDFDDPAINASDQASLDIALFAQFCQKAPDLVPHFASRSDQLRAHRRHLREDPYLAAGGLKPRRKRAAVAQQVSSLASESADTGARSERQSIVHGVLARWNGQQFARPLVVILDTAELVMTQGDAAILELVGWILSLHVIMGADDVRFVIAGRDPPAGPGSNDLLEQLGANAVRPHPPIALTELDQEEAEQLLADSGVDDPATARAAAAAVPRNPLLLRIVSDALQDDSVLAAEVREAHANTRIDASSANAYLARRIVAHLADPVARPYLLAAMYLPSVTRPQLRDILVPAVDGKDGPASPRVAARIFAALRSARWLSRAGADRRHFHFHRDVRALVLKLLAADPAHKKLERNLRLRAVAVHEARPSARDRAYAIYHRALLGERIGTLRRLADIARHLRDVLDDLPADLRARLLGGAPSAPHVQAKAPPTDDEWRVYLEGEGSKDGEGARLLKRDRAAEALALYRDRPTRPGGAPPTFVIRALADLGEWDTGEVDIPSVLEESRAWLAGKRLSSQAMSRLYWVTRFALVRDKAWLSDAHADVLEACCKLMTGEALSTLPALVAIAEAKLDRTLMAPRMRGGRGAIESATRVHLINTRRTRRPITFKPQIEVIAVIQRDWTHRLHREASGSVAWQGLIWAQKALENLDGQPVAAMNPTLSKLRQPVSVQWDGEDLDAGILVLRGQTTEFLRPVRQALLELKLEESAPGLVGGIARAMSERMSILPEELNPEIFLQRLEHDPGAWIAAFVAFADRSRLLPHLCERLAALSGGAPAVQKARRVAESFRSWDLAICGGGQTSGW